MKKLLLITGAVYGIYRLIKSLDQQNENNNHVTESVDTRGGFADGGQTRQSIKAHANHGNIRGIMKKANTISHNLEQEAASAL